MSTHTLITRPGPCVGVCASCGNFDDDMAMGFCFDCCLKGEEKAASRTVAQHLLTALSKLFRYSRWWTLQYDLKWAKERLTRTGDYKKGGYFDRQGYAWRKV
jgi:hypothetical protein